MTTPLTTALSTTTNNDDDKNNNILDISSNSILHLIQHHLRESSLPHTARSIVNESKTSPSSLPSSTHTYLIKCIRDGSWGDVLDILQDLSFSSSLTGNRYTSLLGRMHEMAILELGQVNEIELAFATLRFCDDFLKGKAPIGSVVRDDDDTNHSDDVEDGGYGGGGGGIGEGSEWCRGIEQRLHALVALRNLHSSPEDIVDATTTIQSGNNHQNSLSFILPPDYYGSHRHHHTNHSSNSNKNSIHYKRQKIRNTIANDFNKCLPVAPSGRLVTLIGQAVKWQVHTGENYFFKKCGYILQSFLLVVKYLILYFFTSQNLFFCYLIIHRGNALR